MTTAPKPLPEVKFGKPELPKPKVAGVTSVPSNTTPNVAPAPSAPVESKYPQTLSNGDVLLGEATNLLGNHKMQMIEKKDPSQFFPLFAKCSCGTEGRFYTADAMQRFIEMHMERHPR